MAQQGDKSLTIRAPAFDHEELMYMVEFLDLKMYDAPGYCSSYKRKTYILERLSRKMVQKFGTYHTPRQLQKRFSHLKLRQKSTLEKIRMQIRGQTNDEENEDKNYSSTQLDEQNEDIEMATDDNRQTSPPTSPDSSITVPLNSGSSIDVELCSPTHTSNSVGAINPTMDILAEIHSLHYKLDVMLMKIDLLGNKIMPNSV